MAFHENESRTSGSNETCVGPATCCQGSSDPDGLAWPGPSESGGACSGCECIPGNAADTGSQEDRPFDRSEIGRGNTMNISRRHLTGPLPVAGLIAFGLLGAKAAQAMSADEEAVAKRLEAFRVAQQAASAT